MTLSPLTTRLQLTRHLRNSIQGQVPLLHSRPLEVQPTFAGRKQFIHKKTAKTQIYLDVLGPEALMLTAVQTSLTKLLELKGSGVVGLAPEATVKEAADVMRDAKIGALLVMRGDRLHGILTE